MGRWLTFGNLYVRDSIQLRIRVVSFCRKRKDLISHQNPKRDDISRLKSSLLTLRRTNFPFCSPLGENVSSAIVMVRPVLRGRGLRWAWAWRVLHLEVPKIHQPSRRRPKIRIQEPSMNGAVLAFGGALASAASSCMSSQLGYWGCLLDQNWQ